MVSDSRKANRICRREREKDRERERNLGSLVSSAYRDVNEHLHAVAQTPDTHNSIATPHARVSILNYSRLQNNK